MLVLMATMALASDLDTTTLGELRIPLTPSEGHEVYTGVFEHENADLKSWSSDAEGFECRPRGDFLEVVVERSSWPRHVPKKVTCTADDGRKVKCKVFIDAGSHEAMFVSGGVLVLPREKGNSVVFVGPPPVPDLVVQDGKTGSLSVRCEIRTGPQLYMTVDPETEDGDGQCTLRDKNGEYIRIPLTIRTAP